MIESSSWGVEYGYVASFELAIELLEKNGYFGQAECLMNEYQTRLTRSGEAR